VDEVERELKREAARLKETLDSLSLIPIEDLAASKGVDVPDLSATKQDSEGVFGSMKAAARHALEEARDSTPETATPRDRMLKPFMSAVQSTVAAPVPALETPVPETTTWRDEVLQGDRRLV
jgi:hypothetical protein